MNDNSKEKIAQLALPKDDEYTDSHTVRNGVIIFVLIACAVALFWWIQTTTDAEPQPRPISAPKANIKASEVQQTNPEIPLTANEQSTSKLNTSNKVLEASGHIVARRIATISSRVTSKVEQLLIEEGQRVDQNDVLAELDSRQAAFSYAGAKAALVAGEAQYKELLSQLKLEQLQYERNLALYNNKVIAKDVLDTYELKIEQLKMQLRSRQALNQKAEQDVELSKYNLEQHTIRAPFAGMVIQKNAQVGELISAGTSGGGSIRTGIATIVDMSSLEIEVDIAESYIHRVLPGQSVVARLDAYPDWPINSEVLTIIPTANRQKASIKVRIKLLEGDARILPDMGVKVSFLANDTQRL